MRVRAYRHFLTFYFKSLVRILMPMDILSKDMKLLFNNFYFLMCTTVHNRLYNGYQVRNTS
jgi:hypothetical protein